MEIKINCSCGGRFAFEVEPDGAQVPYAIACPNCGVDCTNAANSYIAQSGEFVDEEVVEDFIIENPEALSSNIPVAPISPGAPISPSSVQAEISPIEASPPAKSGLTVGGRAPTQESVAPAAPAQASASTAPTGTPKLTIGGRHPTDDPPSPAAAPVTTPAAGKPKLTIGGRASGAEPEPEAKGAVADAFAAAVAAEEAKVAQASAAREKRKPERKPESFKAAYIAAALSAAVCVVLWSVFIVKSHFSIPYIAFLVAGVVGTAARMTAPACDPKIGLVAALCTFLAIIGARSIGWTFYLDQADKKGISNDMVFELNEMYKEHLSIAQKTAMTPDEAGMKERCWEWIEFEHDWSYARDPIDAKWDIDGQAQVTPALLADFKRDVLPKLKELAAVVSDETRDKYIAQFTEKEEIEAEKEGAETPIALKLIIGILLGNLGIMKLITLFAAPYVAYNAAAYEM